MNLFPVVMASFLLFFASQSYAIDCYDLNKKSVAYQTCMLRKENADRDYRLEREAKEKSEVEAKEISRENFSGYKKEFENLMVLSDVMNAEKSTLLTLGIKDGGFSCAHVNGEYSVYSLMLCESPAIILFAVNQSNLVQEFSSEIQNKKLEVIFVGGLNVLNKSKNYVLHQHSKGVAIYIELKDSPDVFSAIAEAIRKRRPIEVFFKSEKQSTKFLLDKFI